MPKPLEKNADVKPALTGLAPETAAYADPAHSIGYLLRITFRGFSRALENRTIAHGVSSGQWRFLRQLWLQDGLTQRELSRRVGMREPTTVVAVNSLVKAGFVKRAPSDEDRRKVHIPHHDRQVLVARRPDGVADGRATEYVRHGCRACHLSLLVERRRIALDIIVDQQDAFPVLAQ